MVPKNTLQTVLGVITAVLVLLAFFIILDAPWLDGIPSGIRPLIIVTAVVLFFVLIARAGKLVEREENAWAAAQGFKRSDDPGELANGLTTSVHRGWTGAKDSRAYTGKHRGRRVAVYRHMMGHAGTARPSRSGVLMVVAEIDAALPLVEVSTTTNRSAPVAFGEWSAPRTGQGIPDGVSVRSEDGAYGVEVARFIAPLLGAAEARAATVALDGRKVVAWGRHVNRNALLALACEVADTIPPALIRQYGSK